jgi:hypothetical protein
MPRFTPGRTVNHASALAAGKMRTTDPQQGSPGPTKHSAPRSALATLAEKWRFTRWLAVAAFPNSTTTLRSALRSMLGARIVAGRVSSAARLVSLMLLAGVMVASPVASSPDVQQGPSEPRVGKSLEDDDRLDKAATEPTRPARFQVTQFDVPDRKAAETPALAVDPRTGHLWCAVGESLAVGETVDLDTTGHEFASFPVKGIDIAHDQHTDGFWLVGYGITKLSREGKILFQKPHEGWACVSVAANPRDGSVWIVERAHPDVAGSANRLWHLGADGTTIKTWQLGDKLIFGVACEPKTGTAWVVCLGGDVLRFTADGRELPALPVNARAISISPSTGQVWVTTDMEILQLDSNGRPKTFARFESKSAQSWLAAF